MGTGDWGLGRSFSKSFPCGPFPILRLPSLGEATPTVSLRTGRSVQVPNAQYQDFGFSTRRTRVRLVQVPNAQSKIL